MARKSNAQLRQAHNAVLELRKGSRAQPIPAGRHRGSRTSRENRATRLELRFGD